MECRNLCKYRWFLGLGESIGKLKTVDEKMARRLGWIMGGGGVYVYVYIYIYIYIYIYFCIYLFIFIYILYMHTYYACTGCMLAQIRLQRQMNAY